MTLLPEMSGRVRQIGKALFFLDKPIARQNSLLVMEEVGSQARVKVIGLLLLAPKGALIGSLAARGASGPPVVRAVVHLVGGQAR